jgi:hypothetical protein
MNIECPRCRVSFAATEATPENPALCPSCDHRFSVPALPSERTSDDEFPLPFRIFIVTIGLAGLFFPLAAMTTPGKAGAIITGIALTLLAVWKRQNIDHYFKQRQRLAAQKRAARKEAAAQQAVEAEAAPNESSAAADSDTPGSHVAPSGPAATTDPAAIPARQQPTGNVRAFGPVLDNLLRESADATNAPHASIPSPPRTQPDVPASGFQQQNASSPAASVAPPTPEPVAEPESLTAGLPAKYRKFLDAAMNQSKWTSQELADTAREHHLDWDEAFAAINEWAHERFGDPLLVRDGDEVWVQLPLL